MAFQILPILVLLRMLRVLKYVMVTNGKAAKFQPCEQILKLTNGRNF